MSDPELKKRLERLRGTPFPFPQPEKKTERARVSDEQERRAAVTPKVAEAYTQKEIKAQKEVKPAKIKPPAPLPTPKPPEPLKLAEVKADTTKVLKTVTSSISKAGKSYEKIFKDIVKPLDTSIANIYEASAKAASKGEAGKAAALYSLGIAAKGLRGGYSGLTFWVRPDKWSETAEIVSNLLTAEKGETVKEYQNRVSRFVEGDIKDPKMREQVTKQILESIPAPPGKASQEQRINAKIFRQALAASIMEDPVGFLAELAGGAIGSQLSLKALKKLPGIKDVITTKGLEQRMWDKCTPIDKIETTVPEIHTPTTEWSATLMPKGTWRATWEIAKDVAQKGGTAVVMLADPKTGKVTGYLTWAEAVKISGGVPEAMAAVGGLTAIPVVVKTEELTQAQLKQIPKIEPSYDDYEKMKQEREGQLLLIPTPKIGELEDQLKDQLSRSELEELQDRLQEEEDEAVIVIPTVTETPIQPPPKPTPEPGPPEQVTVQEQALVVEEILEEEQVTIPEGKPPIRLLSKKKKQELRDFRLRLFNGPKVKYNVEFHYKRKDKQSVTVEARSYPEALTKAQRVRRITHELPNMVDMKRVK